MKLIKEDNKRLYIEALYEEIGLIEQSIGVVTGAFKVDNFVEKVGTSETDMEKIRLNLREIVDQNTEYRDLAMNDWNNPKIHLLKTNICLEANSLPWLVNSIKLAISMLPEDEFHTLTGYNSELAEEVSENLVEINERLLK